MESLSLAQVMVALAFLMAGLAGAITTLGSRDADPTFLDRQVQSPVRR